MTQVRTALHLCTDEHLKRELLGTAITGNRGRSNLIGPILRVPASAKA
jgi:hypothetical protein